MILIVAGGDYPHSQWLGGVLGGYGTLLDVKKKFSKNISLVPADSKNYYILTICG